jgi:hypothetical protein
MDSDNENPLIINNNTNNQNSISVPNRDRLDVLRNNSDNINSVVVRDNRNSLQINNNYNIERMQVVNQTTQTGNYLNPLMNENNLLTNENNLLNNNNYYNNNPLVQEPSSSNTNLYKF